MIRAECHSDDHVIEASFDATPWFEQAAAKNIADLRDCGWRGDYPADAVAMYMASHDEDVKRLFTYLELVGDKKDAPGFECSVSEEDAEAWLALHQTVTLGATV